MTKAISRKITALNLIMILVVAAYHTTLRLYYSFIENWSGIAPVFLMMVSGYFFYNGLTRENAWGRVAKRIPTILVPYALWNLLYFGVWMALTGGTYVTSVLDFLYRMIFNPFDLPTWYLLTLFVLILISPLLRPLFANRAVATAVVVLSFVTAFLCYIVFQVEIADSFAGGGYLIRSAEYQPGFFLGAWIGSQAPNRISVSKNRSVFCLAALILVLAGSCIIEYPFALRYFLMLVLPILVWESVPDALFEKHGLPASLTAPAFFVYVLHYLLIFMTNNYLALPFGDGTKRELVILAVALSGCYLLYFILSKITPGFLRLLTGSRGGASGKERGSHRNGGKS